jgi:hypothetical protein
MQLNSAEAIHIISHCPYLLAQYERHRGRDILTTVTVLLKEAGYKPEKLKNDCMRFPTMLAAPADRLRGEQANKRANSRDYIVYYTTIANITFCSVNLLAFSRDILLFFVIYILFYRKLICCN